MELKTLESLLGATRLCAGEREITCGYACDLLSWVMSHGKAGMAWVTVQTHMNVVAVAALHEMACVIVPEGIEVDEKSVERAAEEGIAVFSTAKSAYEVCGLLYQAGVPAVE